MLITDAYLPLSPRRRTAVHKAAPEPKDAVVDTVEKTGGSLDPVAPMAAAGAAVGGPTGAALTLLERRRFRWPFQNRYRTISADEAPERLKKGRELFTQAIDPVRDVQDLAALQLLQGRSPEGPAAAEAVMELSRQGVEFVDHDGYQVYLAADGLHPQEPIEFRYHGLPVHYYRGDSLSPAREHVHALQELESAEYPTPYHRLTALAQFGQEVGWKPDTLAGQPGYADFHRAWEKVRDLETVEAMADPKGPGLETSVGLFEEFGALPGKPGDAAPFLSGGVSPEQLLGLKRALNTSPLEQQDRKDFLHLALRAGVPAEHSMLTEMAGQGFSAQAAGEFLTLLEEPVPSTDHEERVEAFRTLVTSRQLKGPERIYEAMEAVYALFCNRVASGDPSALHTTTRFHQALLAQQPAQLAPTLKAATEPDCAAHLEGLTRLLERGLPHEQLSQAGLTLEALGGASQPVEAVVTALETSKRLGDLPGYLDGLRAHAGDPGLVEFAATMARVGFGSQEVDPFLDLLAEPLPQTSSSERAQALYQLAGLDDPKMPLAAYVVMKELYRTYGDLQRQNLNGALQATLALRDQLLKEDSQPQSLADTLTSYRESVARNPALGPQLLRLVGKGWSGPEAEVGAALLSRSSDPSATEARLDRMLASLESLKLSGHRLQYLELLGSHPDDEAAGGLVEALARAGCAGAEAAKFVTLLEEPGPDSSTPSERFQALGPLVDLENIKQPVALYSVIEAIITAYRADLAQGRTSAEAVERIVQLRDALLAKGAGEEGFLSTLSFFRERACLDAQGLETVLTLVDAGHAAQAGPVYTLLSEAEDPAMARAQLERVVAATTKFKSAAAPFLEALGQAPLCLREFVVRLAEIGCNAEHTAKFAEAVAQPSGSTTPEERAQAFADLVGFDDIKQPLGLYSVIEALFGSYQADTAAGRSHGQATERLEKLRDALMASGSGEQGFLKCLEHYRNHLDDGPEPLVAVLAQGLKGELAPEAAAAFQAGADPAAAGAILKHLASHRWDQTHGPAYLTLLKEAAPEPGRVELLQEMARTGFPGDEARTFQDLVARPLANTTVEERAHALPIMLNLQEPRAPLSQFSTMHGVYDVYADLVRNGTSSESAAQALASAGTSLIAAGVTQEQPFLETLRRSAEALTALSDFGRSVSQRAVDAGWPLAPAAELAAEMELEAGRLSSEERFAAAESLGLFTQGGPLGDAELGLAVYRAFRGLVLSGQTPEEASGFLGAFLEKESANGSAAYVANALRQSMELYLALAAENRTRANIEVAEDYVVIGDVTIGIETSGP